MGVLSLDLPLGFRFCPKDEEIIKLLWLKNSGKKEKCRFICEVPFLKFEPWDLPAFSAIETKDPEWYFFSQLDPKHRNGKQSNRTTEAGYWKVTGKEQEIKVGGLNGKKRILVFYLRRSKECSKDERTNWVTHEYQITLEDGKNPCQIVLCHLFDRSNENRNRRRGQNDRKSEHTKSKPPPASISPVPEVQAEDIQTSNECLHPENFGGTTPDSIATVACTESRYNAFATAIEDDLQLETNLCRWGTQIAGEVGDSDVSDVPPEPVVDGSSLFPLVLLEMQEEIGRMSQPVADDLNCHRGGMPSEYGTNQTAADNSFLPDDVLFLNDLDENHIGDDVNAGKNQVDGVAADELLDSNMFDVVPESPGLSSFCASQLSPLSTEIQKDSGFSWSFEDLEYLLCGEHSQVGPNSTGITAFADSISNNPDEVPPNDLSSQKNIAFDRETQENMESVKDNGSTVHRMQKKPNALLDPTSQDSMWSEEIYGETSSDFLHT